MSDQQNHVLIEQQDGILTIRFNRRDKKNALTTAMYAAILEALIAADQDDSVKVILFAGQPDMFTAGNDLKDFLAQDSAEEPEAMKMLRQLAVQKKPMVAAASGVAVGIGVTLLLHCDLVYAGENTRLRLPFVNLAVVPEAASSLLLPDIMGRQRASELLMLGDFFDARCAREYGIVNAVIANEEVFEYALAKAKALAAKPREALLLTKQLITRARRSDVQQRIDDEGILFGERMVSEEARQVMEAFFTG
ncbi:enoyl-CoA hydratase-related protein [Endozoicomonas sp. SCSIO W0465]|uniref:enoyl-CoA hydratase-related protein n=1 Tax=Endozoicomonas sp. SCSIO W0465 TaxID=2918516 RepID=UPI0020758FCD|nr:enoyl-CoA hydratase-related protein [Endozoicomonas sp. SCSIO W0465]USE38447.1 enoyl-CoA hydratase-related protein [Endozoicomonas sp. SCSIO W0465]